MDVGLCDHNWFLLWEIALSCSQIFQPFAINGMSSSFLLILLQDCSVSSLQPVQVLLCNPIAERTCYRFIFRLRCVIVRVQGSGPCFKAENGKKHLNRVKIMASKCFCSCCQYSCCQVQAGSSVLGGVLIRTPCCDYCLRISLGIIDTMLKLQMLPWVKAAC